MSPTKKKMCDLCYDGNDATLWVDLLECYACQGCAKRYMQELSPVQDD